MKFRNLNKFIIKNLYQYIKQERSIAYEYRTGNEINNLAIGYRIIFRCSTATDFICRFYHRNQSCTFEICQSYSGNIDYHLTYSYYFKKHMVVVYSNFNKKGILIQAERNVCVDNYVIISKNYKYWYCDFMVDGRTYKSKELTKLDKNGKTTCGVVCTIEKGDNCTVTEYRAPTYQLPSSVLNLTESILSKRAA